VRKGRKESLPGFAARVLMVVRRIPPGRVSTYGDVAALAGRARAARAVGNIGGSEALKRSLLAAEGVVVAGTRVRELERVRWTGRR